MSSENHTIVMRSAGVCLVLDLSDGRLPVVVHWGGDLGSLSETEASVLTEAQLNPTGINQVDVPVRLGILPEHWTGWVGRPGVSGSRHGTAWSPHFSVVSCTIDQSPVTDTFTQSGAGLVSVHGEDPNAELALRLDVEMLPSGALRTRAELRNLAHEAYQLDDLTLALPVPPIASELLDFAGRWARERTPQRRDFTVGTHLRENRKGRTGPDSAYLLHAGVTGFGFRSGEVWAVHTAWSGNHIHYAERLFSGEQVLGGGELLLPGEVLLGEGEAYTSPWVYGCYGEGLDEVARRFHQFLRARSNYPTSDRPVTLNVWEAVYFDHSLPALLELAELAASVGVERFVLDDGWFGARRGEKAGLGDWQVSRDVWPDGLNPLIDRVTELGMEFGLWFEPEMVNLDSDVARQHPEWIMAADADRLPVESRFQQVLNIGIPECYEYIRDAMVELLNSYDIRYIKWDHNRDLIEAGTQSSGRPGVHQQTLAFYRLVDELKQGFPGLEIESCSSGGARVDLEVLQRTDRVWVSDCIDPQERQMMHRWTTQLIPPELMGAHIASGVSHTTGRWHTLGFRAATAIFGHLGIEWDLRNATSEEIAELREWIAFHKQHRQLLHNGETVRLDTSDESLIGHGVLSPDRSTALYSLASVGRSMVSMYGRIRLPGLDADRRYRVRPLLPAGTLPGLIPPPWWDISPTVDEHQQDRGHDAVQASKGAVFSGRTLATVGVAHPVVHPETVVLYLAESLD